MSGETSDLDAALTLIKEAHRTGGIRFSVEETRDFLMRPVWLGAPTAQPRGKRGPAKKAVVTQYDLAYQRRKGLYHKIVRLPNSGARSRRALGLCSRGLIKEAYLAASNEKTQEALYAFIQEWFFDRQFAVPDQSSIRKAMKALGLKPRLKRR